MVSCLKCFNEIWNDVSKFRTLWTNPRFMSEMWLDSIGTELRKGIQTRMFIRSQMSGSVLMINLGWKPWIGECSIRSITPKIIAPSILMGMAITRINNAKLGSRLIYAWNQGKGSYKESSIREACLILKIKIISKNF